MTPEQAKILGKIEQQLNDMKEQNRVDAEENKDQHKEIKETIQHNLEKVEGRITLKNGERQVQVIECQKMFDNRIKSPMFMWIVGGMFACLFGIAGFIYDMDRSIENHIIQSEKVWALDNPGKDPVDLHGDHGD